MQEVKSTTKNTGKSPVRIRKFIDHGPNTGFYEPHVDQSECRILQSHIIRRIMCFLSVLLLCTNIMYGLPQIQDCRIDEIASITRFEDII